LKFKPKLSDLFSVFFFKIGKKSSNELDNVSTLDLWLKNNNRNIIKQCNFYSTYIIVPIPNANKLRKNKTDHKTGGLSSVTAKGITMNTSLNRRKNFFFNFLRFVFINSIELTPDLNERILFRDLFSKFFNRIDYQRNKW
jgi:hypothetical protein